MFVVLFIQTTILIKPQKFVVDVVGGLLVVFVVDVVRVVASIIVSVYDNS